MKLNKKRPEASRELRGAENEKCACKFWLAFSRRQVNEIRIGGLLFGRDLLLAGLACLGWPWSRRLSLWVDALDQAAEMLRERQGERA
ncbi:MAG: hypothetical protein AAGU21_13980 [Solidesulfovibrio sp.]|uniref:hypothetical protein n=1 Tax=Solidesulfovibrio sp. TaxID=2910990 RepID=UPI0031587707